MLGWDEYVRNLLADGLCQDAAVFACSCPRLLAAKQQGLFEQMSPQEIKAIMSSDRKTFLVKGLTIGGNKCFVIRDNFHMDGDYTMDIRLKRWDSNHPCHSIAIARSNKVFIMIMGKRGVHGGTLNKKAFQMANYIRRSGC
ncbi:profilin-2-like [Chiloscyllium plagiosum]|uniref:profilin-2-like n=1 Tax=Chiloscyllium plagiosum TaxID=36176 RepID=UPI001CB7C370|nr:profilin-2-like [Chiloscyllium plagiosum]